MGVEERIGTVTRLPDDEFVERVANRPPEPAGRPAEPGYSGLSGPLRPLIELVARLRVSVQVKLLAGFLAGALLLVGMAVLSLVVINRMNDRMSEITRLQEKVDRARQMEYLVTAQSHYRAMSLLTSDSSNLDKIAAAKKDFLTHLDAVDRMSSSTADEFFRRLREANERFRISSDKVLALTRSGDFDGAMKLHLAEEHPVSHELEAAMRELERDAGAEMGHARTNFESDRNLLTGIVAVFSAVSVGLALLFGLVLSSAFVLPVRRMDLALGGIAAGDFGHQVKVPNRDEFGTLGKNLNSMSLHLANLYHDLRSLNEDLEEKVRTQVEQLEKASELRRYLSPQLADSILHGTLKVDQISRRKNLTVFFSDIRNFTATAEKLETEELVDLLNQYLMTMTEIVFKYGGTLDKYIGDAIMVFFGDPIPYDNHAERAVRMAFEMRTRLADLQERWMSLTDEPLTIGMGISTGYVTVGNIGSAARLEYTVLGNTVNLASRLTGRAAPGQILVSERTLAAVRDLVDATEIDLIQLKGVSRPVKVFEINEKSERTAPRRRRTVR